MDPPIPNMANIAYSLLCVLHRFGGSGNAIVRAIYLLIEWSLSATTKLKKNEVLTFFFQVLYRGGSRKNNGWW